MERFTLLGPIISLAVLALSAAAGAWLGANAPVWICAIIGGALGIAAAFCALLKFWTWREGH
jgi:hypothetical protein